MRKRRKVKILIIEDDLVHSIFVESIIMESKYELVGSANTLEKGKAMIDGYKPDILIADVQFQHSTIFELIKENDMKNISFVFMTGHLESDFYENALDVPQSTFIAKPFHKFTLLSALDLLVSKYPVVDTDQYITIRGLQQQVIKIPFYEITWLQSEGNYCFIHTTHQRKYTKKVSLTKLIQDLDNRFIMVHKGFAINTNFILRIDLGSKIINIQDAEIPIGRGFRKELNPFINKRID
ncbi:hypothetical protein GCM10027035_23190 [Emticicia sediminis]